MLANSPIRLAVLNSCLGARISAVDPFAGAAASLVHQGIPAVVAMQFEISDHAAIAFSRTPSEAIAYGWPVDTAVSEARRAILATQQIRVGHPNTISSRPRRTPPRRRTAGQSTGATAACRDRRLGHRLNGRSDMGGNPSRFDTGIPVGVRRDGTAVARSPNRAEPVPPGTGPPRYTVVASARTGNAPLNQAPLPP